MQEIFEKIIERLITGKDKESNSSVPKIRLCDAIEIVNQVAEEYVPEINVENTKLLDSLHEKILKSKFAEEVTEAEIEALVKAKMNMSKKPTSSNEFCEWKCDALGFIINPHTKWMFNNEPRMKNVYCNTCGKKIIVAPYKPKGENNV